jgi:H+/gluconate symporter-like permease
MAKTSTAPFAQTPKTATAVATAAVSGLGTDAPTGAVLLGTAGAEGAIVTRLMALPRATVTASSLVLFLSKDGGTTLRLIDSELMAAHTVAATTAIPETAFGNISDSNPLRLEAGDSLYVGSQVALAAGIVFAAQWMDY